MLRLGLIRLHVQKLEAISTFYESIFGFLRLEQKPGWIRLGYDIPLLELVVSSATTHTQLGLYHAAWRVEQEAELGWMIAFLHNQQIPFEGFADHGVSKAVYFSDIEGNGIEIYWDRPTSEWKRDDQDSINMVTEPLDVNALLSLASKVNDTPKVKLGHVHFYVDSIEKHERFYQALGMKKMVAFGSSASFLAFDEYHHHIGINTWNRQTANPDDIHRLGLGFLTLLLTSDEYTNVKSTLTNLHYTFEESPLGLHVVDPSYHTWIIQT
jgi:catechol 2,3-dioxygenase